MQSAKYQVSGLGRRDRGRYSLSVAKLADQDNVGILAQSVFKSSSVRLRIRTYVSVGKKELFYSYEQTPPDLLR